MLNLKLDDPIELSGVSADSLGAELVAQGSGKAIIRLSAESGSEALAKGKDEAKAKQGAKA